MKDLQELKTWLDAERSKAYDEMQNERGFDREEYNMFKGMYEAFDLCIQKLNLLPYQQTNSEPQPPLQQAGVSGSLPSPYQWLKVDKFKIPYGSTYVEAKDITMRQCAAWISEYVQLLRQ